MKNVNISIIADTSIRRVPAEAASLSLWKKYWTPSALTARKLLFSRLSKFPPVFVAEEASKWMNCSDAVAVCRGKLRKQARTEMVGTATWQRYPHCSLRRSSKKNTAPGKTIPNLNP